MTNNKLDKTTVRCCAVIAAAGNSIRMGDAGSKQYYDILGQPLLSYTIASFEECRLIEEIIIVTKQEDIMKCTKEVINEYGYTKVKKIISGGESRQHSVYKGLCEIEDDFDIVVIHDGARPLITVSDIEAAVYECMTSKAVILGVKAKETIKEASNDGFVSTTLNRENLWIVQTPQVFAVKLILNAHNKAIQDNIIETDDSMLVERLGHPVKIIEGSYQNIKVTTEEDIYLVESILKGKL